MIADNESTFGLYGRSFQEKIVQALLSDKKWAEQVLEVMDVSYFDINYLSYLAEKYFSYAKKYKEFPTLQLLVTIVSDDLRESSDAVMRSQVVEFLKRLRADPDMCDMPYVKDKALDFCRKQALKAALEKAVDLISTDKYETVVDVIRKAVSVGTQPAVGHDFLEEMEARFLKVKRDCCETGIEALDKRGILNGGLGKGELGVVAGHTGIGKCVHPMTNIRVRYMGISVDGKIYKPWSCIKTKRGEVFARDIVSTDELVKE